MLIIRCMDPQIWSTMDIIFCHSGPFFAFLLPWLGKPKFWKKVKRACRHYHFTHVYMISSFFIWCIVPEMWVQQNFFVILDHFLAFYPPNLENQNFGKMKKNTWRYHHFTKMYHKWQSYDVRFLRYGERHIIFCHLLHSLLVH